MAHTDRRTLLADAGLVVLAEQGSHGLTHRAVDRAAEVPLGSTGNYWPSREELIVALCERIMVRLAPSAVTLEDLERRPPDVETYVAYMEDLVRRSLAQPQVSLALFELRLLAAHHERAHGLLRTQLVAAFVADVAYADGAGLPGGTEAVAMLHHAIEGLLFDALTVSTVDDGDPVTRAANLTRRILQG